jgi:hypothetical protein
MNSGAQILGENCGRFKEHAQNGRGVERAARRSEEPGCCTAECSRALCGSCNGLRHDCSCDENNTLAVRVLAKGNGWAVSDFVCTATPSHKPFEEQHSSFSIAVVTGGTFQYRSNHGCALMMPGSLLLGNAGAPFECGHEHGTGDRCLSF